jgi:hypothetical protein
MQQFIEGLLSGLLVVGILVIGFLSLKNNMAEKQLGAEKIKNEDAKDTEKIGGLTNAELNALVSKDLGSSGDMGTASTTPPIKPR